MKKTIFLAGGCFWGVEKYLSLLNGVTDTEVGYANGKTDNPSYEDVCYKDTGHAETVKVTYDSDKIKLENILSDFFNVIDPTSLNRQGNDVGVQYRTGIYYTDENDLEVINNALGNLSKQYDKPLAVEAKKLDNYWSAEDYHQKYLDKNPNGYCHIPLDMFKAR